MNTEHIEEAQVMDITPANKEAAIAKLDNFGDVGEMLSYCESLLKSGILPKSLRKPEAVMAVILTGKELGFGPMASLSQIVMVQDRPTMGVHAIGAKLRQAGVAWNTVEDFATVMGPELDKDTKQPTGREVQVDKRTTIRFRRKWQGETITEDVSFSWRDAERMGLSTKDNWLKQPGVMCWSRALAKGGRRVAPDALLGMMETAEWADVTGQKYTVTEDGEATVVN